VRYTFAVAVVVDCALLRCTRLLLLRCCVGWLPRYVAGYGYVVVTFDLVAPFTFVVTLRLLPVTFYTLLHCWLRCRLRFTYTTLR